MVALAQWIQSQKPEVEPESRVWDFCGHTPDPVEKNARQVVERDWENTDGSTIRPRGYSSTQEEKWDKSRCAALQKLIDLNYRDLGASNQRTMAEVEKYAGWARRAGDVSDGIKIVSIGFAARGAVAALQLKAVGLAPRVLPSATKGTISVQGFRGLELGGEIVRIGQGSAAAADANLVIGMVAGGVAANAVVQRAGRDSLFVRAQQLWGPLRWFASPLESFAYDSLEKANAASDAGFARAKELSNERSQLKQEYRDHCE